MKPHIEVHFQKVLRHIYINPLERCNLACKICYTRKTSPKLTEEQILSFVKRYQKVVEVKVITFCGGEVMLLPYFPHLVNTLNSFGIFVQVITNGTIDRLGEFTNPGMVNLIVSIDGLEPYHDSNRGSGNFQKSIEILKKAMAMKFHHEIFSIVTHDNFSDIDSFETHINRLIGKTEITYHPRKPPEYLSSHPLSNIEGAVKGFGYVNLHEMRELYSKKKVFPPITLGCYQISLVSDGKVYGCCEGTIPLGHMNDDIADLVQKLKDRLCISLRTSEVRNANGCLGCSQPDFMCGIKQLVIRRCDPDATSGEAISSQ